MKGVIWTDVVNSGRSATDFRDLKHNEPGREATGGLDEAWLWSLKAANVKNSGEVCDCECKTRVSVKVLYILFISRLLSSLHCFICYVSASASSMDATCVKIVIVAVVKVVVVLATGSCL